MDEPKQSTKKKDVSNTKSIWGISSVRGKITDKCLWAACKAMSAGFFLILIGTGMATVGFYSDQLSKVEKKQGNITVYHKDGLKDMHLSSLTYFGPVVMGVGGFIILATCVMTFEARDTATKIVPSFFRKSRIHAVQAMGSSPTRHSSDTSWERFLANSCWRGEGSQRSRSVVTRELKNFSKKLQSSMDSAKIVIVEDGRNICNMKKCPSEPFVSKIHELPTEKEDSEQKKETLQLPTEMGKPKPKSLLLAANIYRQAASMDCPKRQLQRQAAQDESLESETTEQKTHLIVQRSDSNSSMAMDLYLPQGAVTLHVKDKTKGKKGTRKHRKTSSSERTERTESKSTQSGSFESDKTVVSQDSVFSHKKISPENSRQQSSEPFQKPRVIITQQSSTVKRNPLMRQKAIDGGQETKSNNEPG
ncbi:uncharacterized protein LOC111620572 [Centruroides sculpturatus]|uniref:uncharacterized protein LOC111620572 n=1 Tax=Centruroides sculpturatus TaxID=218467 RepID=UPI000C6E8CA3|nr:uncharacterized protein LOC111620572 [Centruroides sculpturatus]XP_023218287.1 uncharacterized protein LOC111620572 [Centruroides sculpturatus]